MKTFVSVLFDPKNFPKKDGSQHHYLAFHEMQAYDPGQVILSHGQWRIQGAYPAMSSYRV